MRTSIVKIALAILLASVASPIFAQQLVIGSAGYQSDQWNSQGSNIEISKSNNWTTAYPGSAWVSYAQTGYQWDPNFVDVPVGTVVSFIHVFAVNGTPTGGTLKVMAADTADILLNGVVIKAASTTFGADYYGCGDTFGCRFNTEANITLTAAQLKTGINKLEIKVKKGMVTALNGNKTGFGVDYLMTVNYTSSCVTQ